jgi:hypothetical protein
VIKIFSILIVYLTASIGLPVVSHYCSGKLVSTELLGHNKGCGMTCGKSQKPCCKDEKHLSKLDTKHIGNQAKITVKAFDFIFIPFVNHTFEYTKISTIFSFNSLRQYIPPPDLSVKKIYLLLQVFRI